MVLTHGAGGNADAPLLIAAANAFCGLGFHVLRCDLPFRQRRPTGPPSPATAAADRDGLRNAVAVMRSIAPRKVVLGGQSYGGRQATMLAAEEPHLVDGLLLFSYPLHPPGKPEQLRDAHLKDIRAPMLFIQGSRDAFGTPDEISAVSKRLKLPATLYPIEGGDHSLKVPKGAGVPPDQVYETTMDEISRWLRLKSIDCN